MSHFTKMSIVAQQKFEAELVAAAQEVFGQKAVELHEEKAHLNDWRGGRTNIKANIIVRKDSLLKKLGHAALGNDLGYERNKDGGYDVHADASTAPVDMLNLVAQTYAEKVASKQLKSKGYSVQRQQLDDGRVRLTATKY